MAGPNLYLGGWCPIDGTGVGGKAEMPASHLTTHSVIVGMTGSGKTGLVTVLVEEALRAAIPVLVIDVKGDLPNLKLAFPSFDPALMTPWVEPAPGDDDGIADAPIVQAALEAHREGLGVWAIGEADLAAHAAR